MPVSLTALLLLWTVTAAQGAAVTLAPAELSGWLERVDPPLLLDVRGRAAYLEGTLPGALHAGTNPDGFLPDNRGGPVVLIMRSPPAPEQLAAWTRRLEAGHHTVYLLAGGVEAWRRAGYELERPEEGFNRPGRVPFVIPRGLCEMNPPAQVYE